MATRDDIYNAIRNADKAGDTASVQKLAAYLQTMPADTPPAQANQADPGMIASLGASAGKGFGQVVLNAQNLVGKGVSAVGDLVSPPETSLTTLVTGQKKNGLISSAGHWLQADAQNGLQKIAGEEAPYKEAHPFVTGVGEMAGNVIATLPVGGILAKGAAAIPGVARVAPGLVEAIGTSGMKAGTAAPGVAGAVGNALTRAAGGAITGGVSAGLVDPNQATTGAVVGAAMPTVAKLAGMAGNAIGNLVRGPAQTPEMAAAVQAARDAGYVIPPTQANPTLANRALEGFSGKLTTAQNASAANAATTNRLAAETIGLPGDTVLSPGVLNSVRSNAGQAYDALNSAGTITPGPAYSQALDKITAQAKTAAAGFPNAAPNPLIAKIETLRSPQFDASAAVAQTRELRQAADAAAASGDKGLAGSLRKGSDAIEDAIEAHLQQTGQTQLLTDFQAARQQIAKTYSIERAMNAETGTIDAKKLAQQLQKGKPLSGGLADAARFAARFPKAAQTPEVMGSLPGASPLDFAAAGGMTAASGNPLAMASVLARPAARSLALSPVVQNRLVQSQTPNAITQLLSNDQLAQLGYRVAPSALSDR